LNLNHPTQPWLESNQQALLFAMQGVRQALERHCSQEPAGEREPEPTRSETEPGDALSSLCQTFSLSSFERDLLVLCAGVELEASFAALCAACGDARLGAPTFSMALAALPDAHWSAITPASPLRHWKLIEIGAGEALTTSPLRINERVLHYLVGVQYMDEELQGLLRPAPTARELPDSHQALVRQAIELWTAQQRATPAPVIQLCGPPASGRQAIAAAASSALGMDLFVLEASAIPSEAHERAKLARQLEREAALRGAVLALDRDELAGREGAWAAAALIDETQCLWITFGRDPLPLRLRLSIRLDVKRPSPQEQRLLWQSFLGDKATPLNGAIERISEQFSLAGQNLAASGAEALARAGSDSTRLAAALWQACRRQTRLRLDDLAQRIEPAATFDDLVLPEAQRGILQDILTHVRQRQRVYETWGFAAKSARGLGISALFAGPSGTGKTMAAEVLADELDLDLYRIDLSSVVSKYIGETEKNLRRVFDAAEMGGAILLFDEADALFGKRSEVKDSHDRYANIEVSYLLQRMEAYRGLAILTTNLKNALDPAFLRRIRFVVQFPFPDAEQRSQIWNHIFPADTPTLALDMAKLAHLNVAGGNIRNIALNAAFLAADAGEPVQMQHLLHAARSEYAKLEKALTEGEIKGWA
jgi:AAA+ superfamily predicted ATPase